MSSDSDSSGLPPAACCGGRPRGGSRLPGRIGAVQQVGKPSVAALVGTRRRNRRRFGAARSRHAEIRRRQVRGAAGIAQARRRPRDCSLAASAGGRQHRLFLALHAGAAGAHDIQPAAVTRDDPVQFGQRLDLVDDHLAHLRGVLGGFLRHFQHAAAKLVAGGLQLVMHFRSHLLHALHHGGEPVGRLLEHRIRFLRALLIELVHGLGGQPALLFGRGADRLELVADRGGAGTGGFRHHACDVARALFGGGQQFIQQAGEARQPLVEIGGAQVDRGDQQIQRRLALGDGGGGAAVALFDHAPRPRPAPGREYRTGWTASRDPPAPSRSWC